MGGGDEAENLVRLTPEDHYMAHLLLAKAHGGKLWVAVKAMAGMLNDNSRDHRALLAKRAMVGHANRMSAKYLSENFSGDNSHHADSEVHELRHVDGRAVAGRRGEICAGTGLERSAVSCLVRGVRNTIHGWYSPLHNPSGILGSEIRAAALRKGDNFTLFHIDGRAWSGTRSDFKREFGKELYFPKDQRGVHGWYKSRYDAENRDALKGSAISAATMGRAGKRGLDGSKADKSLYQFIRVATGEKFELTRTDAREKFGLTVKEVHGIVKGNQKTAKGIRVMKMPAASAALAA